MDHSTIDGENLAERYVTRRLSLEEAASFEEHYLDCPACCDRVEAAERLQRGIRLLAEEAGAAPDTTAAAVPASGAAAVNGATGAVTAIRTTRPATASGKTAADSLLAARLETADLFAPPRRSPARLALAAAALLAVALAPAVYERMQIRQLRGDLAAVRASAIAGQTAGTGQIGGTGQTGATGQAATDQTATGQATALHPAAARPGTTQVPAAGAAAGANPAPPTAGSPSAGDTLAALSGTLAAARRELAAEAAKREVLERQIAAERQGIGDVPVVSLAPARGGGTGNAGEGGAGGPQRTVVLPRQGGWIALWVEPGGDDYPSYRATLRDAQGRTAFETGGLSVNDLGALLLMVRSSALAAGIYRLDLDGLPKSAAPVAVGRYSLKVISAGGSADR